MTQATEAGEYLLHWVDPRAGIATDAIKRNGGAWMLRYYNATRTPPLSDGPCNYDLTEYADAVTLAPWVASQLGYPVTLTLTGKPRRWVPYRFRDCGEGTHYDVTPATRPEG
jgi:hypothetical protein